MNFYEEDVRGYVASFNGEDFDSVIGRLGDDLEISLNGSVVMKLPEDQDKIFGSYKADFAIHKRVEISREPEFHFSGDGEEQEANVSVELSYDSPEGTRVSLDVVYVYNTQTKKQRRHLISNVKMSDPANK